MGFIDLRSDTVTLPTPAMREAMANAEVGDDVFCDDPTINRLEALAADILGKEAALFVPSGTMGNEIAVMAHTKRGDAIIAGPHCHIIENEAGGYAQLSGVSAVYAPEKDGFPDAGVLAGFIAGDENVHMAPTGLVCLENATALGIVAPVWAMEAVYEVARSRGVPVHLDGARLFNAAVSLGVNVKELTAFADSVMCCLSKGLCAPVGSVLAGSAAFIRQARRCRKMLGGGMRQAGILAAAGIIAITEMPARLKEDHANARFLAEGLAKIPGITVDIDRVHINMLFFKADWPQPVLDALPARMRAEGIKIVAPHGSEFRFVTNNGVSREDCARVLKLLEQFSPAR